MSPPNFVVEDRPVSEPFPRRRTWTGRRAKLKKLWRLLWEPLDPEESFP